MPKSLLKLLRRLAHTIEGITIGSVVVLGIACMLIGALPNMSSVGAIGSNLLAAGLVAAIFFIPDTLKKQGEDEVLNASISKIIKDAIAAKEKRDNEFRVQLKSELIEAIRAENLASKQYRFFLCPPITSCLDVSSGFASAESRQKLANINAFALALKERLKQEGPVYYGGQEFAEQVAQRGNDYTKDNLSDYISRVQAERLKTLQSSECMIVFLVPDLTRPSGGVFEAGVAHGKKINALYFYDSRVLPSTMDARSDLVQLEGEGNIERRICEYSLHPSEQEETIDYFSRRIISFHTRAIKRTDRVR